MKKMMLYAVAILAISMSGCKSGSNDPKGVLSSFIDALSKKDFNAAKKYATKDSESMLGMMEMAMKMAPTTDKDKEEYNKDNMEFGDAKIEGDKATVPVKNKKSGETSDYTLKKEGGQWKVAFDKATMSQMGADKMKGMNNGNGAGMPDSTGSMNGTTLPDTTNMMNNMKTDTVH